mgnify:CR=1 FL=1
MAVPARAEEGGQPARLARYQDNCQTLVEGMARPPGYRNRKIEAEVARLSGLKSLYSDSYYTEAEFWALHDRAAYAALKHRYDPAGALPDLYAKCVLRKG